MAVERCLCVRPVYCGLSALLSSVLSVGCENPVAPVACGPLPQVTVNVGEISNVAACFNDANGDVLTLHGHVVESSDRYHLPRRHHDHRHRSRAGQHDGHRDDQEPPGASPECASAHRDLAIGATILFEKRKKP